MLENINLFLAFGAGFLNFISPCTLPLYPAFISYITGMSLNDMTSDRVKINRSGIIHTIIFLLGFSVIFIFLGYSSSLVGTFFYQYQDLLRQLGSIFIIIFGLIILGFFSPSFLMKEKKIQFKNRPVGYFGTFLIGLAFAAGWTPCTGPITGAVFLMAAQNPGSGIWYMLVYVLGFAIPFLLLSIFITRVKWIQKYNRLITKVGGYIMVVLGFVLFFDGLTYIIIWLSPFFSGFMGF
ncbi:cytochrome C biogenesis protein CcdA [Sporosarcina sp. P21c]|uniref:cytochrome c biogenesis CcdA family protein n=1 Tax=unclassified Sporosarcina TaxID=2647733 RepID=UPI000C16FA36|nr:MULTISPECIES: cytochrome c biogenesis protein CcdA [unclassified Sporosarcina]PIC67434.1 cytochrome C biogenesis protein CcdA [Sporosarcina sp. P16a]PIC89689.1 cytochrome C biogenesis protein CcdA [Sporosarcina sp. P21c]PIC92885.1 cytochrome C biogenesis protein CcdA [Sporosarcina sp. P25]